MADQKLTGLTNTPSAADDDQIYIVDVSDTTDDPTGTSKSIEVADLLAGTADASHTHTESDITDLGPYADAVHTHVQADITDLAITASDVDAEASTDGQVLTSDGAGNAAWETVSGGGGGVPEAPNDGKQYGRESEAWTEITGGGGGSAPARTKVLIREIELTTAGEFDFDNIPSGFDRLSIEGTLKSSAASGADSVYALFNADTTLTNYTSVVDGSFGTAGNVGPDNTVANNPRVTTAESSTTAANDLSPVVVRIEDYAGSNVKKATCEYGTSYAANSYAVGKGYMVSSVTDPITRLRFRTDNHPTNGLTGKLQLFGEQAVTIEDSETLTVKQSVPVVFSGGQFDIDLSSYQDGDRLIIQGWSGSDKADNNDGMSIVLNGDGVATNYRMLQQSQSASSESYAEVDSNGICEIPANLATADSAEIEIRIEDYAGTRFRTMRGNSTYQLSAANMRHCRRCTFWENSDPITSITLIPSGGTNLTGELKCYIEKQGVMPSIGGGGGATVFKQLSEPTTQLEGDVWFVGDTTAPVDEHYDSVTALAKFEDGDGSVTVADETSGTWSMTGTTSEVTTDQAKFGTGSFVGGGTLSSLQLTNPPEIVAGDFTIEFHGAPVGTHETFGRVFQTANGDVATAISLTAASAGQTSDLTLTATPMGIASTTILTSPVANQFYHFCFMRKSGILYAFVDGVLKATGTFQTTFSDGPVWIWGGQSVNASRNTGYAIDEVRITDGVARYDETGFTAPTLEYATQLEAVLTDTRIADSDLNFTPVVTAGGGGMVEIETITDPVSGEFDFTNIPQTYRRLVIKGYIKSASANAADTCRVWINGLGGSTTDYYRSRYLNNNGATIDDATSANDVASIGGSGGINDGSSFGLEVENYTEAGVTKFLLGSSAWAESTTHIAQSEYIVRHKTNTDALDEILIRTDGGDALSGTLTLYGEM